MPTAPRIATAIPVPKGLEGVVVADTSVGEVRGQEGFFHYRQYSAVDLAATRSFEDVWHLLVCGSLPDAGDGAAFSATVRSLRALPEGLARLLPAISTVGGPLDVLRTAVSLLGAELGWQPTFGTDPSDLRDQGLRLGAVVATILAAAHRLQAGLAPVEPRADLGHAANFLWMLHGSEPDPDHARSLEQYPVPAVDHGFNASTFAARVITSTGADLAAAVCGAIGALSGPLHGAAPGKVLDMLDQIGDARRAEQWIRAAVGRGERIMGFGHRVYRTDDPRSTFLRAVALRLGGPQAELAAAVERTVVDVLAEHKPGRALYTNVEFFAGVVMVACGIPRPMLTPTFAAARTIGWTAHIQEQAADNRLIRPAARYVGPPAPVPVPEPARSF